MNIKDNQYKFDCFISIDPEYKMKSGTATPSSTLQNSIHNDHELLSKSLGEENRKTYLTGVSYNILCLVSSFFSFTLFLKVKCLYLVCEFTYKTRR